MPEYVFLEELPATPQVRTQIFRLAPPQVTERALLGLAQQFELAGNKRSGILQQDAGQITYLEGLFELTLHRASGGLRFHDNSRWQVDDGASNVTFGDDDAVAFANRHIERLDVVPLNESQVVQVNRLHVGVAERNSGYVQERVIDVGVAFQRLVDGVPVEGPGGLAVVNLDHNGDLTGVDRIWRALQSVYRADVELRPPAAAQDDVVRYWGREGSGRIEIEDMRFGYYELGWDDTQRFLQPAYVMPLSMTSTVGRFAGHSVIRSEHVVAAAINPVGSLMPPRPVVTPQMPHRNEQ